MSYALNEELHFILRTLIGDLEKTLPIGRSPSNLPFIPRSIRDVELVP